MTIYEVIQNEHAVLLAMTRELLNGKVRTQKHAKKLVAQLAHLLKTHGAQEERLFYPELRHGDIEIQADQAIECHDKIEALMDELESFEVEGADWTNTLRSLEAMLREHMTFEEDVLFEKAEVLMPAERAEELGALWETTRAVHGKQSA